MFPLLSCAPIPSRNQAKEQSAIAPTVSPPPSPISTTKPSATIPLTLSPSPFPISIPTLTPTPSCITTLNGNRIYVLSDDLSAHPGPDDEQLDQALLSSYPNWAAFTQKLPWHDEPVSVGQVFDDASFTKEFQVNPAVTLVTVMVKLDHKLPNNGDLFSIARETAHLLDLHYWKYAFDDVDKTTHIKEKHPEIENAATYSIYAYFEYDMEKLDTWCRTYIELFNQSPLIPP
jgi:hypothetical protein